MTTGYIYLCAGMTDLLFNSIKSLLAVNPEARIEVLGHSRPGYDCRELKTRVLQIAPFDLNLYVDCDVVFNKLVDPEAMLDGADIAMALDPHPTLEAAHRQDWSEEHVNTEELAKTLFECGGDWPFLNGGVMAFRRCAAMHFLGMCWHQHWKQYRKADQFALARALFLTGIKFNVLAPTYNSYVIGENAAPDPEAKIHHFIWGDKVALMKKHGRWLL